MVMETYQGGAEFGVPAGTRHAVSCWRCPGLQPLTDEDYARQMSAVNHLWACPNCGNQASWSDEVYEAYLNWEEQFEPPNWITEFPSSPSSYGPMTLTRMDAHIAEHGEGAKEVQRLGAAGWTPYCGGAYCGPCGNAGGLYQHEATEQVHCWRCLAHISGAPVDEIMGHTPPAGSD